MRERSPATHRRHDDPASRDLRLLAGAAGLSALGDFMAVFPLILHVQQRTGSAFAVSALIFALWGRSSSPPGSRARSSTASRTARLLIVVSLAQAAVVAAMLAGADSLWALLPLMALLGFGVAVGQPAEFALVPAAAGDDATSARANGRMETARSLGFTAGPLVGGALGAAGLLRLALALNALLVRRRRASPALALRARRRPAARPRRRARAAPATASRSCSRERDLAITLGGAVAALAVFSISATAEPFFVTDVLHAGPLAYGVLLTSWTLGMAAGSAGARPPRRRRRALAAAALVAVVAPGRSASPAPRSRRCCGWR